MCFTNIQRGLYFDKARSRLSTLTNADVHQYLERVALRIFSPSKPWWRSYRIADAEEAQHIDRWSYSQWFDYWVETGEYLITPTGLDKHIYTDDTTNLLLRIVHDRIHHLNALTFSVSDEWISFYEMNKIVPMRQTERVVLRSEIIYTRLYYELVGAYAPPRLFTCLEDVEALCHRCHEGVFS